MHEAKMHSENSFLTLTYAPEFLPASGSLVVEDCQLFMKRLRKFLEPKKVRFFLCGEYGEQLSRPHYHVILFGHDFRDKVKLVDQAGLVVYESRDLANIWGKGMVRVGSVTFESASYVASYALKKVTNNKEYIDAAGKVWPSADAHYKGRCPEFLLMSRKPGIGRAWYDLFSSDVFPSDEVIVRGRSCRPPRYYGTLLKVRDTLEYEKVISKREVEASKLERVHLKGHGEVDVNLSRNARRLREMEKVANAKLKLKSRRLEKA